MTSEYNWYNTLNKPFFAPPAYLFGTVWSVLYPIIFLSFSYVFYLFIKKHINAKQTLPFVINLIANFLFWPVQFGLQNNFLASIDVIIVLSTIVWGMCSIYKANKLVAYTQIPYLIWVGFATILQISITVLNI